MKDIEYWQNRFTEALNSDLEHGVRWLNEIAWEDFKKFYPELCKTLGDFHEAE